MSERESRRRRRTKAALKTGGAGKDRAQDRARQGKAGPGVRELELNVN